jgi:hypothetical protein
MTVLVRNSTTGEITGYTMWFVEPTFITKTKARVGQARDRVRAIRLPRPHLPFTIVREKEQGWEN